MSQQKLELKREFGVFAGCSLVAAGMIGSGIFLSPGIVLKNCGNFWVSIGVWIITGFIALAGALCYLELALLIPKTGGPYHYLTKGLGKFTGYEYMWINAVFTRPASMAVAALSFAQYVVENKANYVAIILVIVWSSLVFWSTTVSRDIIKICTIIKVTCLVAIVIVGTVMFCINGFQFKGGLNYENSSVMLTQTWLTTWTTAAFSAFWSYDGWDCLSYVSTEVINPQRTFPIVTWICTPGIMILYVLVNFSYQVVLSPTQIAESSALVADWGQALFGESGRILMTVMVCVSTFGSGMATGVVSSRLTYGAAVDESSKEEKELCLSTGGTSDYDDPILWRPFGYLHVKRNTPILAIILNGTVAALLLLVLRTFEAVTNAYGWAAWAFQLLIFASVFTLRYQNKKYKHVKRQYQVPIVFVALNILAAASVVFLPIIDLQYMTFIIAGSLLLIGVVFYFWKPMSDDFDKTAVKYLQQLLQIA